MSLSSGPPWSPDSSEPCWIWPRWDIAARERAKRETRLEKIEIESIRVEARRGVADLVRRDGVRAAEAHGASPPEPGASGDSILTVVRVPGEAAALTGGSLPHRGLLVVQGFHVRRDAWAHRAHRVCVVLDERAVLASAWAPGPWGGDSVLRAGPHLADLPPGVDL